MKFAYLIEPPFNYLDENGAVTGCDVELARRIFRVLGISGVSFVETSFAELLPGLALGRWQMTTGLFATAERRQHAFFSRPIWALPDGLLIRSEDKSRIRGYRDLTTDDGFSLGVVKNQVQHETALDIGIAANRIRVFDTYADAALAVMDGRVSAYASVARAHEGHLLRNPDPKITSIVVPTSEKRPACGCYGFAKSDPDLNAAFDEALSAFLGGSAHRRLMSTFGFSDADIDLLV